MPDWDDYHAFISTSSDNTDSDNSSTCSGCSVSVLTWIIVFLSIVWLIGELFG